MRWRFVMSIVVICLSFTENGAISLEFGASKLESEDLSIRMSALRAYPQPIQQTQPNSPVHTAKSNRLVSGNLHNSVEQMALP
jgi:hypothetical protein